MHPGVDKECFFFHSVVHSQTKTSLVFIIWGVMYMLGKKKKLGEIWYFMNHCRSKLAIDKMDSIFSPSNHVACYTT